MAQSVNGFGPPPILAANRAQPQAATNSEKLKGNRILSRSAAGPPAVEGVRDTVGCEEGPIGKREEAGGRGMAQEAAQPAQDGKGRLPGDPANRSSV